MSVDALEAIFKCGVLLGIVLLVFWAISDGEIPFTKHRSYRRPHARVVDSRTVEVTGDAETLQKNMYNVISGGSWERTDSGSWLYRASGEYAEYIAEAINKAKNGV